MLFNTIISKEGFPLRLHSSHPIFSNNAFKLNNLNSPTDIPYKYLYMMASNFNYDLFDKNEIITYLQLVDMLIMTDTKIKVLDYLITVNDDFDPIPYLTPDVLEIKPEYFILFPDVVDNYIDLFNNICNQYNDVKLNNLKGKKFLQYCKEGNFNGAEILFQTKNILSGFDLACQSGSISIIEFLYKQDGSEYLNDITVVNNGMAYSALGGHLFLIEYFREMGASNWDLGLNYAARGGHLSLVKYFIDLGANKWKDGMMNASYSGDLSLVKFFEDLGANNWNDCIIIASSIGNLNIVEYCLSKGANLLNQSMINAALGGHLSLVEFFINLGANALNQAMGAAASSSNFDIINYLINLGADDWNLGLIESIQNNNYNLIDFFLLKGANNFEEAIKNSLLNYDLDILKIFFDKRKESLDYYLCYAYKYGSEQPIIDYLIELGAKSDNCDDYDYDYN